MAITPQIEFCESRNEPRQTRLLRVMAEAHTHSIPLVITQDGGYSKPIELSAEAHANTFRVAAQVFR